MAGSCGAKQAGCGLLAMACTGSSFVCSGAKPLRVETGQQPASWWCADALVAKQTCSALFEGNKKMCMSACRCQFWRHVSFTAVFP
jgi:hypothetical protein